MAGEGAIAPITYSAVRGGDIRIRNRRLVLEWIERQGPISRAELSRLTELSQPSVSEIVNDLLASGLVEWSGEGDSTGGRPPRLLRFNPTRGTVLAADLGGTTMALGLFRLDGSCLREQQFAVPKGVEGPVIVERLVSAVRQLLDRAPGGSDELLAMGIGAPGVTDVASGEVSLAPAVGWEGTPVRHLVEQALEIPVRVDNDVNTAALAEWRFGGGAAYRSFAFVSLGSGVGMGVILNGELHRGDANQAGEIGYLLMEPDWENGSNGFGNLDARLSLAALGFDYLRRIGEAAESGESVKSAESAEEHTSLARGEKLAMRGGEGAADAARVRGPESAEEIDAAVGRLFQDYGAGKAAARSFLRERMNLLARALVNVHAVLAPEAIFIGGPVSPYAPELIPLLETELRRLSPFRLRLERSALRQRAGLIGACALASDTAKAALTE